MSNDSPIRPEFTEDQAEALLTYTETSIQSDDSFDEFREKVSDARDELEQPIRKGGSMATDTGPRKWSHGDENPVMCQHCGSTWAGNSLYKTGDVLRCPGCDGVMRP